MPEWDTVVKCKGDNNADKGMWAEETHEQWAVVQLITPSVI